MFIYVVGVRVRVRVGADDGAEDGRDAHRVRRTPEHDLAVLTAVYGQYCFSAVRSPVLTLRPTSRFFSRVCQAIDEWLPLQHLHHAACRCLK